MGIQFVVLGTGAGPGLPSFFCDCPACREVREKPELERTRSGAALIAEEQVTLIDASPDLRRQLIREGIRRVDAVFMTHWHYDHFGGLGELEYYVKLERKEAVPLYLPPSAVSEFAAAFPELGDVFQVIPWEFGREFRLNSLGVTPLEACHSVETAGFLLEAGAQRLAYFPDTAGLPEAAAKRVRGVDWLVCDATFYGENWFPNAHMSWEEAVHWGERVQARQTVLTHMAIHYSRPVTRRQLEEWLEAHPGALAAYDGMRLRLA